MIITTNEGSTYQLIGQGGHFELTRLTDGNTSSGSEDFGRVGEVYPAGRVVIQIGHMMQVRGACYGTITTSPVTRIDG